MPELPEVETVRRSLLPLVQDKKNSAISNNWEKIHLHGLTAFTKQVVGAADSTIDRRGKYLLIRLKHGMAID